MSAAFQAARNAVLPTALTGDRYGLLLALLRAAIWSRAALASSQEVS